MICPQCNKSFTPRAVNQKYCSHQCQNLAGTQRYFERDEPPIPVGARPIDEFICKTCGKTVFIYDRFDKRTAYCSGKCCIAYCKKLTAQKRRRVRGNLGMSGGMCLGSLIKRERRDLD